MQTSPPSIERKVALITGITGQDGSYLAELLLEKGYAVRFILFFIVLVVSSPESYTSPAPLPKTHRSMGSFDDHLPSTLQEFITCTRIVMKRISPCFYITETCVMQPI